MFAQTLSFYAYCYFLKQIVAENNSRYNLQYNFSVLIEEPRAGGLI